MATDRRKVTIYLDPKADGDLSTIAREAGRSKSSLIRDLVRDMIGARKRPRGDRVRRRKTA